MLILTKSMLSLMIGFLFAIACGIILVPFLRKKKIDQSISIYLEEAHRSKNGTPTMGGMIFLLPTIVTLFLLYFAHKIAWSYTLTIAVVALLGYGMIGFLDDYLIIKRHSNKGLTEKEKMLLQLLVALVFFFLFMKGDNEPLLWIHALGLKVNIGWLYGIFILLVLASSSNAVNLTDGLDGLAGGLSAIATLTFGIITWNTGWLKGYEELAILCFILTGAILGFLLFNSHPAKIFMGDTGSLALGAFLGSVAILTRHELLLILIGIVFVLETLSCVIQRTYYKFTKKRIFPMTPIHHSFEKWGMKETEIVKLFWVVGFLAALVATIYGVWL